jgi:hypothetical protein
VESKGSSPRRQDSLRAVTANGDMQNSIGGIMEHKFVEMAGERLKEQGTGDKEETSIRNKFMINQPLRTRGMICPEQTILLYKVKQEDKSKSLPLLLRWRKIKRDVNSLPAGYNSIRRSLNDVDYTFHTETAGCIKKRQVQKISFSLSAADTVLFFQN